MVPFLMVAVAPDKTLAGAAVAGSGEGVVGEDAEEIRAIRFVFLQNIRRTIHETHSFLVYEVQWATTLNLTRKAMSLSSCS